MSRQSGLMLHQRAIAFAVLFFVCATLAGCGGGSSMVASSNPTPATPAVSSITPTSMAAGSGQFNLMLSGQGFSARSAVHFGSDVLTPVGMPQACSSGSNCETITVAVPAKDVATVGPVNVFVANGTLDSNTVVFTVSNPANTPQILAFLPTVGPAGGPGFTLAILGLNVAPGATLNFGSVQLTPTSIVNCNPGQICPELVQVPASAIASAGMVSLTLTNPGANGGTSSAVSFLVLGKTSFPIEESVSNASPPAPANSNSTHSSIAAGAAFVAFDSTATNLVPGATNGLSQVYVRNNCFAGVPNCVAQTTLVSAAPDGSPGAGGVRGSERPAISLDGRFVAFESDDTNLVPGAAQAVEQVYLRDTCNTIFGTLTGCTPTTTLISATAAGTPGNGPSLNPTISALGFFVAFQSTATNLASPAPPANVSQVYLSRQCPLLPFLGPIPGCTSSLALASFDANGNAGDKDSINASLDPVGFVLSFESLADNIVAGTPGNGFEQVYARDTCFLLSFPGIPLPCTNVTVAVSVDGSGQLGAGDSISPAVSFGGLVMAYATRAQNIVPASTSSQQIIGVTTCILENAFGLPCPQLRTAVVSVDQSGVPGKGDSSNPAIDGEKIAFTSLASLLPNVSGQQVYIANSCLLTACTPTTVLVSADSNGNPIGGDFAALEGAGAFATFATTGSSSAPGTSEVFLSGFFF